MAEFFIGQIMLFAAPFAPKYFAFCNGQLMPINQNTALFSLLGTYYGGDGVTTFALPDLRGTTPIGFQQGPGLNNYTHAQRGGSAEVTLTADQLPAHTHLALAADVRGDTNAPANAAWARATLGRVKDRTYAAAPDQTVMAADALTLSGNGQPHNNMPPFAVLNFIIALQGIYPSRN